jgi:mono/diheme cytochrome c family protein
MNIKSHFTALSALKILFIALSAASQHAICLGQNLSTPSADTIRQTVAEAGQAFKKGDLNQAVALINRSSDQIKRLAQESGNARSLDSLKPTYAILSKAHEFLSKKDAKALSDLPSWVDLKKIASEKAPTTPSEPDASAAGGVSFVDDVAPWLVAKCGNCHIDGAKGAFSMADIASLMKGSKAGVVLFPGDSAGSTIVESIRSGDMPRGGGKVTSAELAKLEQWIQQGALFDKAVATRPLKQLVSKSANGKSTGDSMEEAGKNMARNLANTKPTGKETVSFSRDIAPILMENCNGCHVDATRLRGGLNMNNFSLFSKGGDSGEIVEPKNAAKSLLVQKIKGLSGDRMPAGGRPALSDDKIQLISTWIEEGAFYDGQSPTASLATINAKAWSESATYEEVMERRRERALNKWKVAYGSQKPSEASDRNFVVMGNVSQAAIDEVLVTANQANEKVRKALKIDANDELAKGGVAIFVIKGRYDYSEFGKMTESRTLPNTWNSHWRRDALDVYIAILHDSKDMKVNEANLTQQLASVWVSQFEETPAWFSDGFGRSVLAITGGKSDTYGKSQLKNWDEQIGTIVRNMKGTKELLDGKMNEEDAALVGYGLCRKMIDVNGRRQFASLLQSLGKTKSFPQAFQLAIGPMEPSIAAALGLPSVKASK